MTKKITFAGIIPLVGGGILGTSDALDGQLPEYLLSYSPFAANDSHAINYLRTQRNWKGDYVLLDEDTNYVAKQVDVVTSLCPCAGLSSLSTKSSADSPTNDWMYKTAEYVLNQIGPKVFFGENAPRLSSASGKKVADRLREIGKAAGYSLTLYSTESRIHGLSQRRPRTWYFFTKSENAVIFPTFARPTKTIEEILKKKVLKSDPMNVRVNNKSPYDNPWIAYVLHSRGFTTLKELYDTLEKSQNFLCIAAFSEHSKPLNEIAEWFDENGHAHAARKARHMKAKLDDNKGFWGHAELLPKHTIPAFVGALPHVMINPFTEKYVSIREGMRIMGMPEDFNLLGDNPTRSVNVVCQNVSPSIATDMMSGVIKYLNGELTLGPSSYIRQSNKNGKVESMLGDNLATLESFLDVQ